MGAAPEAVRGNNRAGGLRPAGQFITLSTLLTIPILTSMSPSVGSTCMTEVEPYQSPSHPQAIGERREP